MAIKETTITSAAGETGFVRCTAGAGHIGLTGSISAGAVLLIVKPFGSDTEYVADTIDATVLQTNSDEAGTGYGFFEAVVVPRDAQIALAANATFSGSVTACVISEDAV